jgi:hypothetical protein
LGIFVYNWSIKNLKVMCLYSSTGKKIAERDIVCYKALCYFEGRYYTPVKWKLVKDAVLSGRRLLRGGLFCQTYAIDSSLTRVEGGYIHVYNKLKWCHINFPEMAYFKCIIPKGTEYWLSESRKDIAARKIRFVKQVK